MAIVQAICCMVTFMDAFINEHIYEHIYVLETHEIIVSGLTEERNVI